LKYKKALKRVLSFNKNEMLTDLKTWLLDLNTWKKEK